jgi:hypothetical protein
MMSLMNPPQQNRFRSIGLQPVVSGVAPETVGRRGVVLNPADELLRMTLELLRMTIELLHLLRTTLDEIWRDTRASYLKNRPQPL